ncbi:MAG TPA: cation:dicarboxylase symporter family transporter [Tepidisphaeraceae bacterium]|nr:cation:dicarboxylase symporter family transporter [Tepidisphaeraceae bacterium]
MHSLMTAKLGAGIAFRLGWLLLLNTLVAIGIGLLVANTIRPGEAAHVTPAAEKSAGGKNDFDNFLDKLMEAVPESLYKPLVDNNVIAIVLIGVGFPLLLTVDWFLDRSRTVINMLGDVNVSCLMDGLRMMSDK